MGAGPDFSNCGDAVTPPAGFRDLGDSNYANSDFYNDNDERRQSDLVGESERMSILTTGEYDIGLFGDDQVYFEAFYSNRQNFAIGTLEQIFPTVTALIDEVDANGVVIGQVDNPLSPLPFNFAPILTLDDITQTRDVELSQIRLVGGYRGGIDVGWFGEIDIPLITDRQGIELLNFDGSLRQTEESSYSGTTYRIRGQYKPVEWASQSGAYGTSFRAPFL
ncbi:MAG: hypothetical protein JKX72_12285 [Robiginitomaculum sp.]|nr:hypothetical protein [Robiginitomaculum sp.]